VIYLAKLIEFEWLQQSFDPYARDDNVLISAFRWGLRDDVKDLLFNLSDPLTLTKTIIQAVRCNNRLFEHR
jgi:hypothetical protein